MNVYLDRVNEMKKFDGDRIEEDEKKKNSENSRRPSAAKSWYPNLQNEGRERKKIKTEEIARKAHAKSLVVNLFIQASNAINYQDKMQANVTDTRKTRHRTTKWMNEWMNEETKRRRESKRRKFNVIELKKNFKNLHHIAKQETSEIYFISTFTFFFFFFFFHFTFVFLLFSFISFLFFASTSYPRSFGDQLKMLKHRPNGSTISVPMWIQKKGTQEKEKLWILYRWLMSENVECQL